MISTMASTRNYISMTAVLLVISFTFVSSANSLFTAKFLDHINQAPQENVTRVEVQNFYSRFGDSPINRCTFMTVLVDVYRFDSLKASALFDVLQWNDGASLTLNEFIMGMMGNEEVDVIGSDTFWQNLDRISGSVNDTIARPFAMVNGPTQYERTEFLLEDLMAAFDRDSNGVLTREELSVGMRSFDLDGDWGIYRCEFVDAMQSYRQHAVTSAKFYDLLFGSRDLAWSDRDSSFLGMMMNKNRDDTVTTSEFRWFFNLENDVASGVPLRSETLLIDNAAAGVYASVLLVISVVLPAICYMFTI